MQAKKTVRKTDRPRARTQPGSAVCAETCRQESTAIQQAPANMQAPTDA
jgi:hypothetical protein